MSAQRVILIVAVALAVGIAWLRGGFVGLADRSEVVPLTIAPGDGLDIAVFAAGCFWSAQAAFDDVDGVVSTTSGYTGGRVPNPTYSQVSSGSTGHAEAVQVVFDPALVSYEDLLDRFWRTVDPFVAHRQFCDVGEQYRPEIFVRDDAQRTAAEASRARIRQRFDRPIAVRITDAAPFYRAEAYHQGYHVRYAAQYRVYRVGCGRDARLAQIWGQSVQRSRE